MHRGSLVLSMVFVVTIISLLSTPEDAFAADVPVNIPSGTPPNPCLPNLCYTPDYVVVDQFDTVTWTNLGGMHTATSGSPGNADGRWDSGVIPNGMTFTQAMDTPGIFPYYCTIHPWQNGTVEVTPADNPVSIPTTAGDPSCASTLNECYDPESLTVDQGELVTWTNDDPTDHHTTTSGVPGSPDGFWDSGGGPLPTDGLQFQDTFTLDTSTLEPGTYPYYCLYHPWQVGSITVTSVPSYHSVQIFDAQEWVPDNITILENDWVTWNNADTTGSQHSSISGSSDGVTGTPDGIWTGPVLFFEQFYTRQFTSAGGFDYYDGEDPAAIGRVNVVDQLNLDPIPQKIQKGDITVDVEPFVSGLISPVHLTHNGDGSGDVYIVDQPGFVYRADEFGGLQATPFLDISSQVHMPGFFGTQDENDFDERGFLGLAFHPEYNDGGAAGEGLLYTFHTEVYPAAPVSIPDGAGDIDCAMDTDACYDPESLVVPQGMVVRWTNNDSIFTEGHTTVSGTQGGGPDGFWDSPVLMLGDTFELDTSSLALGAYPYYCTIHPWQAGSLTVIAGPAPPVSDFPITMTGIPDNIVVITEWGVDASTLGTGTILVDPSTERRIMTVEEPQFNHEGGMLGFNPDGSGNLYIALGDGGSADDVADGHTAVTGNAQDESNLLGSILRINPINDGTCVASANGEYCIPPSNPNVGVSGELDEIYANGLRNNWRFSWYEATMYGADVGQNQIEEINTIENDGNYGWNAREGTFGFDSSTALIDSSPTPGGMTDPILQYDHDEGTSITGGYVYPPGGAIPELAEMYVFGDFSTGFFAPDGRLFYFDVTAVTPEILELQLSGGDPPLGLFLKSFGQGPFGEIYVLAGPNLGPFMTMGGQSLGVVLKIVPDTGGGLTGMTQGQVDIVAAPTCGITFVAGAPINYEALNPGQESTQKLIILDNTGDTLAELYVRGGDWLDALLIVQMLVSDSHFTLDSNDAYGDMTPLDTVDQLVTSSFDPNTDLQMFWQLVANLLNAIFEGSLVQPIDYTVSC